MTTTVLRDLLVKIGLQPLQAKIYLACLSAGTTTPSALARVLGVSRGAIYAALSTLFEYGLIKQTLLKKQKLLKAASPDRVRKLLERMRNSLEDDLAEFEQISAKWKVEDRSQISPSGVDILSGIAGLRNVLDELLRSKSDFYWVGSMETLLSIISPDELFKKFTYKRMGGRTTSWLITDRSVENYPRFAEEIGSMRKIKVVDQLFRENVILLFYTNQVSILIVSKQDVQIIRVESEALYSLMKKMFQGWWKAISPQ